MAKGTARQYLRPGNHTRIRNTCTHGRGTDARCTNPPVNRVYVNAGTIAESTLLLCPVHVLPYLDVPLDYAHVNRINHRYRDAREYPPARDYHDVYNGS